MEKPQRDTSNCILFQDRRIEMLSGTRREDLVIHTALPSPQHCLHHPRFAEQLPSSHSMSQNQYSQLLHLKRPAQLPTRSRCKLHLTNSLSY